MFSKNFGDQHFYLGKFITSGKQFKEKDERKRETKEKTKEKEKVPKRKRKLKRKKREKERRKRRNIIPPFSVCKHTLPPMTFYLLQ